MFDLQFDGNTVHEHYKVWSPDWVLKDADSLRNSLPAKAWTMSHENEMYIDFYNTRNSFHRILKCVSCERFHFSLQQRAAYSFQ